MICGQSIHFRTTLPYLGGQESVEGIRCKMQVFVSKERCVRLCVLHVWCLEKLSIMLVGIRHVLWRILAKNDKILAPSCVL